MAWFSNNKQQNQQLNITDWLAQLNSDGVNLTIEELIPYQNKTPLIALTPKKQLASKMSGNYLARSKGRGMEFDEVRDYQVGDDIRAIDWRVTARTGVTHTKLFHEEVERPVFIASDLTHTMHFGSKLLFKSVQAGHLAALIAWHAKVKGDRLGGIVFNETQHLELKPRSRQQGVLHYLHALCEIQNKQVTPNKLAAKQAFIDNCARLRQLAKPGALVYLITDGYQLDENAVRHLALISQHCELVVCLVSDPLEHHLPENLITTTVAITDGENRQDLVLGDQKIAKQYQSFSETLHAQKVTLLEKAGARVLSLCASMPIEQQLKNENSQWLR